MTREELVALAKEADCAIHEIAELERFAALVAAKEREKVADWMMQRALATGHGDTIEDMLVELEWQIREKEREKMLEELRLLADADGRVQLARKP
jgi:hypothetical protein